jgi:ABC-type lipoprotein release transport system permease subunit
MGITGFNIAFFGTLLNIICGALIAYNIGNKIKYEVNA